MLSLRISGRRGAQTYVIVSREMVQSIAKDGTNRKIKGNQVDRDSSDNTAFKTSDYHPANSNCKESTTDLHDYLNIQDLHIPLHANGIPTSLV